MIHLPLLSSTGFSHTVLFCFTDTILACLYACMFAFSLNFSIMALMKCGASQCILCNFMSYFDWFVELAAVTWRVFGLRFLTVSEFCCKLPLVTKAPNQQSVEVSESV